METAILGDNTNKNNKEINYRILRLIVGLIAIFIAIVTTFLFCLYSGQNMIPTSISVTYHLGARDFFVGSLFAVGAFLIAYNGFSKTELVLAKFAGVFAILVAACPTTVNLDWIEANNIPFSESVCLVIKVDEETGQRVCNTRGAGIIPVIHGGSAFMLIGILCFYCYGFFHRAGLKLQKHPSMIRLKIRRTLYFVCGSSMGLSAIVGGTLQYINNSPGNTAIFWVEFVCLWAFGISWLVASKRLPFISHTKIEEDNADAELEADVSLSSK